MGVMNDPKEDLLEAIAAGTKYNQIASILLKTDADSDGRGITTDGSWERLDAVNALTDQELLVGVDALAFLLETDAADQAITLKFGEAGATVPEVAVYSLTTLGGPQKVLFDLSSSVLDTPGSIFLSHIAVLGAKYLRITAFGRIAE